MASEQLGEGDCLLIENILDVDIFETLKEEVSWRQEDLRGGALPRLVAMQGELADDGYEPLYRFPTDHQPPLSPFTPLVDRIRRRAETLIGQPVNHCLIQLYRDGRDYISEHSDKTLDIVPGTAILTVSFGATRTMVLRTKRRDNRVVQRIKLRNGSLFVIGLQTNKKWTHEIRQDKRMEGLKSSDELDYDGQRISLTFRQIGTFWNRQGAKAVIYGQGATEKLASGAKPVVDTADERDKLLIAFSRENKDENFDREAAYGGGFDVVNTAMSSTN